MLIQKYKYEEAVKSLLKEISSIFGEDSSKEFDKFLTSVASTDNISQKDLTNSLNIAIGGVRELGLSPISVKALMISEIGEENLSDISVNREAAKLLEGIQKIETLDTRRADIHSENFRNLLMALAGDIRVILIMMIRELFICQNFETLTDKEKKKSISNIEHLYAPLAHRLGLYRVKTEMEEFVMLRRNPDQYQHINKKLQESEEDRLNYIKEFIEPIKTKLGDQGFKFDIKFRTKAVSSIWKKMQKQGVDVEGVFDLFAIRIIDKGGVSNEKSRCWSIYSEVTDLYTPDPSRLRDWISTPRPSGYESLHTTVLGPDDRWVEVQIRTDRMDVVAEEGPAAHWRYKGGKDKGSDQWLVQARQMLEQPTKLENSELASIDLSGSDIFTLTPMGDLLRLPPQASILDFAFNIHSEVGLSCKGGKVNGRIVPIRHKLNNGDVIEIITGKKQKPAEDWLKIVKSARAKNKIRRALKEIKESDYLEGKEILMRKFRQWKLNFSDENINSLINHLKVKDTLTLYKKIANTQVTTAEIKQFFEADKTQVTQEKETVEVSDKDVRKLLGEDDFLLINDEMRTADYSLANCCNPVYGDDVFGFITVGKGIRIHRNRCPNAADMKTRYPYRVIKAKWELEKERSKRNFKIQVTGKDQLGIINQITNVISNDLRVMMRSLQVDEKGGKFKAQINIYIKDAGHLDQLCHKIEKVKGVEKVQRLKK